MKTLKVKNIGLNDGSFDIAGHSVYNNRVYIFWHVFSQI